MKRLAVAMLLAVVALVSVLKMARSFAEELVNLPPTFEEHLLFIGENKEASVSLVEGGIEKSILIPSWAKRIRVVTAEREVEYSLPLEKRFDPGLPENMSLQQEDRWLNVKWEEHFSPVTIDAEDGKFFLTDKISDRINTYTRPQRK